MVADRVGGSQAARRLLAQAEGLRVTEDDAQASEQLERALKLGALEPALEAELRIKLADCYYDLNESERGYEVVGPVLDNPPDEIWRARALVRVARVLYFRAETDAARSACLTASARLASTVHHLDYALAQLWLGHTERLIAGFPGARRAYRAAIASAERAGSLWLQAAGLNSLGSLETRSGRLALAEQLLLEARALDKDAGHRPDVARVHFGLAVCRLHAGNWSGAEESLARADEIQRALGDHKGLVLNRALEARGLRLRGRDASAVLDEVDRRAAELDLVRLRAQVREERGYAALDRGEFEVAREHFEALLGRSVRGLVGDDVLYDVRNGLALALLELGQRDRASEEARLSLEGACKSDDSLSEAGARITLGRIDHDIAEIERAIAALSNAGAGPELLRAHRAAVSVLGPVPERAWHIRQVQRLEAELGLAPAALDARGGSALDEGRVPIPADVTEQVLALASFGGGVLVRGESGVGRAQVVAAIHEASSREGPLVRLNCRGVSSNRFIRELLGEAEQGGALARAQGGTLALENVDHLSPESRAVLHRELEVAGSGSSWAVVSTAAGGFGPGPDSAFAPDLFARIAGITITVPSLAQRPGSIRIAVESWTGRTLSPRLYTALARYRWPGNFTELREAVRAALFLAKGAPLEPRHFPNLAGASQERHGLRTLIDELETREIVRALEETDGNKTKAAELLGISRKGLFDRLKRLGLWDRP